MGEFATIKWVFNVKDWTYALLKMSKSRHKSSVLRRKFGKKALSCRGVSILTSVFHKDF